MGGIVKSVTKPFSKVLGSLTGADSQKKMVDQQNRQMAEQMRQSTQQAIRQSQDMQQQAAHQQKSAEGQMEREQAAREAADSAAKARQGSESDVDVDLSINPVETGEDGRRINEREKFMSKRTVASSGLKL